jgi:hypothetical protein
MIPVVAAPVPVNYQGMATMLGAVGAFLGVVAKIISDWLKEKEAVRERTAARLVATETAAAVGVVKDTTAKVDTHLGTQDGTLDLIHTASNSNLAASEARNAAAEAKIQQMANDAITSISTQMTTLKSELANRDATKAADEAARAATALKAMTDQVALLQAQLAARDHANGIARPRRRPRRRKR